MAEVSTEQRSPIERLGDIEGKLMDLGALLEGMAAYGLEHAGVDEGGGDSVERMARIAKGLVDSIIEATQETEFALRHSG